MALIVQREGLTTTDSMRNKPMLCHACRTRKTGVFTLSADNKPMCGDCAAAIGRPIP